MSKKIVFLADCLITQKAGIHFYTKQFIKRSISQYPDNQYYIVLPYPYKELDAEEIIVPTKSFIPFHFRLRSFFGIPRAIKKIQPDLVIEMAHFGPFGIPTQIKRATVIHDLTPILFPEWHDRLSTLMHNQLLPGILKKADHLIVNSLKTKADLLAYSEETKGKIHLSYPSIRHKQNEDESENKINEKYLLTVGTIEPRKNYDKLIIAFDKLAKTFSDLHLRIVGYKGWKSNSVYNLIEKSSYKNRIILEGYTTEERLKNLYRNAYAFVFPSLYEGFGLPVLEALSHGLTIICSDIPTSREICDDAAIYFDKDNQNELAEKLFELLNNEPKRLELRAKSKERFIKFNSQKLDLDALFA